MPPSSLNSVQFVNALFALSLGYSSEQHCKRISSLYAHVYARLRSANWMLQKAVLTQGPVSRGGYIVARLSTAQSALRSALGDHIPPSEFGEEWTDPFAEVDTEAAAPGKYWNSQVQAWIDHHVAVGVVLHPDSLHLYPRSSLEQHVAFTLSAGAWSSGRQRCKPVSSL